MDKVKYFDAKSIKGKYQHAVAADTAKALAHFCEQEPEFEQAVEQSGKSFQECRFGWVKYPDWVETPDDLYGCSFEYGCTLGFDKGRPEDEPTEEELKEFEKWCERR